MSGNYVILLMVEANYLLTVIRGRGDILLWGQKLNMTSNMAVVHSSRHFCSQLCYTSDNRECGG